MEADRRDIVIYAESEECRGRAGGLAADTGAALVESRKEADEAGLALVLGENGLSLVGGGMELRADFTEMLPRVRPDRLNREMVVRAARIKKAQAPLRVLDATAGLGEDSFLLAAAGFEVSLYERDPVIAALLGDALMRAGADDDPRLSETAGHMTLFRQDSICAMNDMAAAEAPDVVLLDPMFPKRRKTGLIKKKFQLLQRLESPCADEKELLQAAMTAHPRRIVIKRPRKGPYLADVKPGYSIEGKTIRYDCIVMNR